MLPRHWGLVCVLVPFCLSLGACGTKQTLEQTIQCDQFKRLPDGTWSTKDVSLDFVQDGRQYQFNFANGSTITGKKGADEALILAAIEKKCAAKQ